MAYKYGQCSSMFELLDAIVETASKDSWSVIRSYKLTYNSVSRQGGVLLKGVGDGNDAIYIEICVNPNDVTEFIIDASAGSDVNLEIWEQPGSIQQWVKVEDNETTGLPEYSYTEKQNGKDVTINRKIPSLSITDNERFNYFIFSDTYRVIVVCKLSIDYQSMYLGFINPVSSEKQYPYPMYVAGNNIVDNKRWPHTLTNSFIFPTEGTGYLRRADGTWREFEFPYSTSLDYRSVGALFPYDCNNTSLVPNYEEATTTETNFLLIPIILHTNNPLDMNGLLRGVYWISGTRDIATEQIVVINNVQYMVFDSGNIRGNNSYFCIQVEA